MNYGAFIYEKEALSQSELTGVEELALEVSDQRDPLHASGKYASLNWYKYSLDPDLEFIKKILKSIGTDKAELIDFYYLDPGAILHPHRDLTGASLNNRIRFHVPVITNSKVNFEVSYEKMDMKPGDLWCLDTSYLHSVRNDGVESRVHIVIECYMNDQIKKHMPNNLKSKLHSAYFVFIMVWSLFKSFVINIFTNPKYLYIQIRMVIRFIKWRFFGLK